MKAYAIITKDGKVCRNLIRDTKIGCLHAHAAMFKGICWAEAKEMGYRVKKVVVKVKL